MSEGRPGTPARRPETARPRQDDPGTVPDPPSVDELDRIERQLARLTQLSGARLDDRAVPGATLLTWPGHGPGFNHAAMVRWPDGDWTEHVAAVAARLRADREPPAVVVADGLTRPSGLPDLLRRAGWVQLVRETVMWTRRAAVVPHLDPSMRIEAVTAERAAAYEEVERAAFGLSAAEAVDRLAALRSGIGTGALRAYLVRVGDEPVATARLAVEGRIGAIHGVGVVPRSRRRGYGRLVTTVVTRAALAVTGTGGLAWLSVADGNAAARGLYDSLDYRLAFTWELLMAARR